MEFLQPMIDKMGLGPTGYYVIILPLFFGLSLLFSILLKNQNKNAGAKFLKENPTAAKVYIETDEGFIHSNSLSILTVDDDYLKARIYMEGKKAALYLLPGEHVIESEFRTTRPGILHKSVTKIYGPDKNSITVEANKKYSYKFSRKEEQYSFTEVKDA